MAMTGGLLLLFIALRQVYSATDEVQEYSKAEFLLVDAAAPPRANDARWHPLSLPHLWSARGDVGHGGWYRLHIPISHRPEHLQGIYLSRLNMNAAVYLNGELLGDGGNMLEPLARNWNRPLYFNVPHNVWRDGDNDLLIHLRTYPGFGMLAPIEIGADAVLKPVYLRQQFVQNELSFTFTALLAMVGFYTLGLWLRRKSDSLYLWFALSCFFWSFFNTSLFVRYAVLPPVLYQKLTHIALDFWMLFLVGFVHRYLGRLHPHREIWLFSIQTLLSLAFFILPITRGYGITHLAHALTLGLAVYLVGLAWRHWRIERSAEALSIILAFGALVLAGLHDWLMENPIPGLLSWETLVALWRNQFHLLFFMVPALILFLALHLTQRFIRALNESERLNRELEHRIAAAQQILADTYAERRTVELSQATTEERERIYRDLHDDVGAKLLGLAISAQRANQTREADLARSALQDLRDVVSRSMQEATPIGDLLADWRAETAQRIDAAGLILEWRFPEQKNVVMVSTEAVLNLSRIVREAVTNVLHHASASRVVVTTQLESDRLLLTISDDGIGCPSGFKPHRGMASMQARAVTMGGILSWSAVKPHGCVVHLDTPLQSLTP